jgi:hypothetical protein
MVRASSEVMLVRLCKNYGASLLWGDVVRLCKDYGASLLWGDVVRLCKDYGASLLWGDVSALMQELRTKVCAFWIFLYFSTAVIFTL